MAKNEQFDICFKTYDGPTGFEDAPVIKGPDFDDDTLTFDKIFDSYLNIGFQASHMGQAIEEIKRMLRWRLSDDEFDPAKPFPRDPEERKKIGCRIFMSATSNMTSCGLREIIRWLMKHKLIDVYVTTCGGIEEDFMKCMRNFVLGDFHLKGRDLRLKTLNRTGNLIVPNENYAVFETWLMPLLDECLKEQQEKGTHWTPSRLIWRMGERINNEESIFYWAWKNKIPVFCPAITDGSIGD